MTARRQRYLRGLMAPRRHRTIVFYGQEPRTGSNPAAVLDATLDEVRPAIHREARCDDPWLSPMKSEAVQALGILIAHAQAHVTVVTPTTDIDLEAIFLDAGLTDRQREVASMTAEGWGLERIAEWLGISRQTVSQHLYYGRRKLIRQVLPMDTYLRILYSGAG